MALPGQSSGDHSEGSSALRILYVGHRNSMSATLTTDGFTQTNPPVVAANKSTTLSATPKYGILSASVAFARPDAGNGFVGGPLAAKPADGMLRPLGLFINDAAGNAFENTPAVSSGQAPYVCSQGTMGARLYETHVLQGANLASALVYEVGDRLYASQNGYLTNAKSTSGLAAPDTDDDGDIWEVTLGGVALADATVMGVVKIVPDSTHAEIVFDLRV